MLPAAAGVQTRGFGLSYHGWGEGAGSRAAFRHIPSCHLCPGWAEWMPEQQRAACASLKCCLQQEGTCHILGAHSHRNPGAVCGQKQQVCFASQPLTTISLPFNSHPKWLEVPQKPHSKYWSFYTGVVFSHTDFSCNLPHHVQGDPKTGMGKGNSSSQGISGDSPALLHLHLGSNTITTWCKLQSLHKELCHKLAGFRFYLRKLFCSDMTYARPATIPQSAFFPITCQPWFSCPPAAKAVPWARSKNWLWFWLQPIRNFPKLQFLSFCSSSTLRVKLA